MNLVLLHEHQFIDSNTVRLKGRYVEHIQQILKARIGDRIWVGQVNGLCGFAEISKIDASTVTLELDELSTASPATIPLTVVMGLPRPRMLQRSLQTMATLGVERIHLIQSQRVEKSFWQTPLLKAEAIEEQLILGLEQAKATQMPEIYFHKNFNYFINNDAPALFANQPSFIAHPGDYPSPVPQSSASTIVIGPEGGFIPSEVQRFCDLGCQPIQIGARILRVETAVPVLIAKLY